MFRLGGIGFVACVAAGLSAPLALAQTAAPPLSLPGMVVVGNTPLPGSGVDIDKVPGDVDILGSGALWRDGQNDPAPAAAARRLSSVNLNSEQGSRYQQDFVYRGFEASPISGVPQGIAVYQNGVRINEAFGDLVNWELVPQFAVQQMTLQSNNPVFGLNALGGAVTLTMKNGFNFQGTDLQLSGGSYGNITGFAEHGARYGNFGIYGAIGGVHDDGYRYRNATGIKQGYFDLGWENNDLAIHLSTSLADSHLGATGPTPVELLARDIKSTFTYPQSIANKAALVQLAATWRAADDWLFSGNVYYRHFHQNLIDGNTTDVAGCNPPNAGFFCLGVPITDASGNPVPASALPAGATPGEIDFSTTDTNAIGTGYQAAFTRPLWGHDNNFVAGITFDHSATGYTAHGELGSIAPSLDVVGAGITIHGVGEQPVDVGATNDYLGLYATDTFNLTPRLAITASGRFNLARIAIADRTGAAPALNGDHTYGHFNPGAGLTYKLTDNVTAYGGWSEANRAPTAAELTCSDPANPCILDAFLVADPPLKQVVSQTFEIGLRGHFAAAAVPGRFLWHLGVYRTDSDNDIQLLGVAQNGYGYFANAGTTRRQGIEAGLAWRWERWLLTANYSYLDAAFLNHLTLSSNSPAADANGFIYVKPGDHIPLMPAHRLVLNGEFQATPRWKLGADLRFVSGQYLAGDQSNQEPQLPAYTTLDLHSAYKVTDTITVFGEIDNLFDHRYYTYGTFTGLDGLPPTINLTNPRTYTPAPGRTFYGGVRMAF